MVFFFKPKTDYEMRISDWSSDVCSSDLFAWSAPEESPALVEASVAAVERRSLARTVVIEGVGLPSDEQVPSICSQGGLGTNFHGILIPTIAEIGRAPRRERVSQYV